MKLMRNVAAGFALAVMCFGVVAAQAANPSPFSVNKVSHPNGIVATPTVFLVSSQDLVSDGAGGFNSLIYSLDNNGNVIGGGPFVTITHAIAHTNNIQEVYMAAAPGTGGSWTAFDIYACRGNKVFHIPSAGGIVDGNAPFATLSGASDRVHCGITFDRFGTNFGFDMIVTTEGDDGTPGAGGSIGGAVYRVTHSGGTVAVNKQLAFVAGSTSTNVAEGPQVVPTGFSGASGQLLFTQEDNPGPAGTTGTVFEMTSGLTVASYKAMKEPESVHLVPPTVCNYGTTQGGFFTTDFFNNTIIKYPATDFATIHGNVLVPQEFTTANNNIEMIAASNAAVSHFDATEPAGLPDIVHEGSTFVECGPAIMPIIKHSTDPNVTPNNADFIFGLFPRADSSFPAPPADPFGYTDNSPASRGAAATTAPENNLPIDLSQGTFNAAVCEIAHTAGWTFGGTFTATFTGSPTNGLTNTASVPFHPTGETTDPQIECINLSIQPGTTEVDLNVYDTPPQGNVVVIKNTVGGNGTFGYTGTGSGISSTFSLTTVNNTKSISFSNIATGAKTIAENDPTVNPGNGWTFTSLSCVDGANPIGTVTNRSVSFSLASGHTVTCTFTNTLPPPTGIGFCSPGLWKTHPITYTSHSSLTENTLLSTLGINFHSRVVGKPDGLAGTPIANITISQGLALQGGGYNALTRATLNAYLGSVVFGTHAKYSTAQVITMASAAYAGNGTNPFTAVESCPIDANGTLSF